MSFRWIPISLREKASPYNGLQAPTSHGPLLPWFHLPFTPLALSLERSRLVHSGVLTRAVPLPWKICLWIPQSPHFTSFKSCKCHILRESFLKFLGQYRTFCLPHPLPKYICVCFLSSLPALFFFIALTTSCIIRFTYLLFLLLYWNIRCLMTEMCLFAAVSSESST